MSNTLRARVRGGRLVDDLDPAERARLHGFLADSIRTHVPGTGVSAEDVLARVRAKH